MYSKIIFKLSTLFMFSFFLLSCSSDDNGGSSGSSRIIKYEITGTYSGDLDVYYTDVNNNLKSEVITTLPWSKTITYPSTVSTIGITAQSVIANAGETGETGSLKIYSGSTVKRTSDKTVGENGLLIFDTQTYSFQ